MHLLTYPNTSGTIWHQTCCFWCMFCLVGLEWRFLVVFMLTDDAYREKWRVMYVGIGNQRICRRNSSSLTEQYRNRQKFRENRKTGTHHWTGPVRAVYNPINLERRLISHRSIHYSIRKSRGVETIKPAYYPEREEPPAGVLTEPLRKPLVFHYAITQRLTRSKYLGEFTGTGPVSIARRDNAYTGADGLFMQARMCVWPRQMREAARWEDGDALPDFPISSWLWRGSWGIVRAQKDYKSAAE